MLAPIDAAALADRLRRVRVELFGEEGAAELAHRLGLPERTWLNFEAGVTMSGPVLLRFLVLTGVEPAWLAGAPVPADRPPPPAAGG